MYQDVIKNILLPIDDKFQFGCRLVSTPGGYYIHITILPLKILEIDIQSSFIKTEHLGFVPKNFFHDFIYSNFFQKRNFRNFMEIPIGEFIQYFSKLREIVSKKPYNEEQFLKLEDWFQYHYHSIKMVIESSGQEEAIQPEPENSSRRTFPGIKKANENDRFYLTYSFCVKQKSIPIEGRLLLTEDVLDTFIKIVFS
jgi:hypothetical protein